MIWVVFFIFSVIFCDNTYPGLRFAFPQQTADYMVPLLVGVGEKSVKVNIPDATYNVNTPEGSISLSLSNFVLDNFKVNDPKGTIIGSQEAEISSSNVIVSGSTKFSYAGKSGPQSGIATIHQLSGSFSVVLGGDIDPSEPSNLKFTCSKFSVKFTSYNVTVEGGESWFQNVFENLLSATLLNVLVSQVTNKVPPMIESLAQSTLGLIPFDYDLGFCDISFSYQFESFVLNNEKEYFSFGSHGAFQKPGISFSEQPAATPEFIDNGKMAEFFFTQYTFDSLSNAIIQGNCVNYTMAGMFFENTKYFKDLIPNLPYRYPDKNMEIVFTLDRNNPPTFSFQNGKLILQTLVDHNWKVLLDVEGPMTAFELSTALTMEGTFQVTNTQGGYPHLSGNWNLTDVQTTIKYTFVGPFKINELADIIETIFAGIVVPLVNAMFELGMTLPQIPNIVLKQPKVLIKDGFMQLLTDFTFNPPSNQKNNKL